MRHSGFTFLFMDILDPDFINMRPIGGGQEPPTKPLPPEQIRTQYYGSIYNPADDKYDDWMLSAYRPRSDARPINFAGGGVAEIIGPSPGVRILITNITFTVNGETNITLYAGGIPMSGPMDFGGTGEPRGITMSFPYAPLYWGGAWRIASSAAVQVSGMVTFMLV